uniref:At2g23090-like zinc-binding domain-containing protein n=1 Tax=Ditylum brightwellii TaxID=49249 RepID=A0A6U3R4F5_9STRA|mmetsp:Transcript_8086/g.10872  ORF Transcript_8086/g.10872 Transcript_8086/m.10872 type:complete len:133 (+) Transcript_8086:123-521(+)
MGKGSNVQKAQAARERNQKKMGKSDEERKAAKAKADKDASAFMCKLCRQTFMVNAKLPVLYLHVTSKHGNATDPASCFDQLAGYDPNDPKGEKAASAAKEAAPKKKVKKKEDLSDLLDAGLSMGKSKKKSLK